MTRDLAEDLIGSSSFGGRSDEISALLLPSVRISAARLAGGNPGPSYFGGRPVLPPGVEWPRWDATPMFESERRYFERLRQENPRSKGRVDPEIKRIERQLTKPWFPMNFLAQIDFGHLAAGGAREAASALPAHGRLLFFYDLINAPWGFDPGHKGGSRVIYADAPYRGGLPAGPTDYHPPVHEFHRSTLRFSADWTLPDDYRPDDVGENQDWLDAYRELRESLVGSESGVHHRMLGHPQRVQGDMRLECQLASNGLYCGDGSGYGAPGSS